MPNPTPNLLEQIGADHLLNKGHGSILTSWIRSLSTDPISDGTWNRWMDLALGTVRQQTSNGRSAIVRKCSVLCAIRLMLLISYGGRSQLLPVSGRQTAAMTGAELAELVADYCDRFPDQVELLQTTSTAMGVGFEYLPSAVAFVAGPEYGSKIKWRRVLQKQTERLGIAWDQYKLYTHSEIQAIADEIKRSAKRGRPRRTGPDAPKGDLHTFRRFA
jgi:hypothetical protein